MKTCECVRNEYLRCCEFSCIVFMCKICFVNLNSNTIIFVSSPDDKDSSDSDTDSDSYLGSYSYSDDKVLEPLISDDDNYLQMDKIGIATNSNEEDENILEEDIIEDLLITTYDANVTLDRNVDVVNNLMSELNKVPNTNAG